MDKKDVSCTNYFTYEYKFSGKSLILIKFNKNLWVSNSGTSYPETLRTGNLLFLFQKGNYKIQ